MARTVYLCSHLHLKLVYVNVSFDNCISLNGEEFLHEDVALHGAEEIYIRASEAALDDSLRTYHDLALREKLAVYLTVYSDIIVR